MITDFIQSPKWFFKKKFEQKVKQISISSVLQDKIIYSYNAIHFLRLFIHKRNCLFS